MSHERMSWHNRREDQLGLLIEKICQVTLFVRTSMTKKILAFGPVNVGKTCLLYRFRKGEFLEGASPTVGPDNTKINLVNGYDQSVDLDLWDTAGAEQWKSVAASFYRNSDLALLCFSLNCVPLDQADAVLGHELDIFRNYCPSSLVALVLTKADLIRTDEWISVDEYCRSFCSARTDMGPYFRTSARSGEGVEELLRWIADTAPTLKSSDEIPRSLPLVPREEKGCCG
jgi:small GTP-binding protein